MYGKLKTGATYTLEQSLGFDYEDLAANARGVLSERQQILFNQKRQRWFLLFSGLSVLCGVLALQAFGRVFAGDINIAVDFTIYCILGAVAVFIIIAAYKQWNGYTQAIAAPLETIEGPVNLDIVSNGKTLQYSIAVGDVQFFVTKPVFLAFKNGDPYRIYYAPVAKMIVSAEWLRGE